MQFSNHMTPFLQNFFYILDLFFKHSSSAQMFNLVLWSFRRDDDRIANADLGKIGTPLCTIMTHESRNSGLPRIFTFRNRFVGFYNSQLGLIVNSIRFEIDSAPSPIMNYIFTFYYTMQFKNFGDKLTTGQKVACPKNL